MRKPLIAGNWKMNGSIGLAADLRQAMQPGFEKSSVEVVICPPFSLLQSMGECFVKHQFPWELKMFILRFREHTRVKPLQPC